MANEFRGRGNLGSSPTLKHVTTADGERRAVAELRIYFDRSVPDGADGFTDKGGFWLDVSLWGNRAEGAAKVLEKGMRVSAGGTLVNHQWEDKDTGEPRSRFELQGDYVDLDISRVAQIQLRNKERSDDAQTD